MDRRGGSWRRAEFPSLVFLSHFRGDHVAGLFDLKAPPPDMAWHTATDHFAGLGDLAALRAGGPALLRDRLLASHIAQAEDLPHLETGLPGFMIGYDVTGNGAIIAIRIPVHGTDKTGLYSSGTRHFLIANATYSRTDPRRNTPPPRHALC